VLAAVNGPRSGTAALLALACDAVVARESAYVLLAFVNRDDDSSLLIPAHAGFAQAAEMVLLGERIPARQALEWAWSTASWPTTSSRPRSTRWPNASPAGADRLVRRQQVRTQRVAVLAHRCHGASSRQTCRRGWACSRRS
jgi:enoyl-CoA hydratase/carnithine racemase